MKKSFLYGGLLGLVGCLVMWIVLSPESFVFGPEPEVNESIRRAFNATCKIETNGSVGTGVLLDTGYIITAAHLIDLNSNGKIDFNEKIVNVKFYGDKAMTIKARSVFIGRQNSYDFAMLEPLVKIVSDISIAKVTPLYGDEMFTVGMTRGFGPFVTKGYHSWNRGFSGRASMFIHQGNSGGGVFSENQTVHGVVVRTVFSKEIAPVRVMVPMQTKGGIRLVHAYGDARYLNHLALWCEYVNIKTIRKRLGNRGLLFLAEIQEEYNPFDWTYIKMITQILGVIACGIWFKKDFLS